MTPAQLDLRLSRLHSSMQRNVSTRRERENAGVVVNVAAPSPSSNPSARRPPVRQRRSSEGADSSDLRARLRPIFDQFDIDRSGAISTSEMGAVCKAMKVEMTDAQMTTMMREADTDGRYACGAKLRPAVRPGAATRLCAYARLRHDTR